MGIKKSNGVYHWADVASGNLTHYWVDTYNTVNTDTIVTGYSATVAYTDFINI